MKVFRFENHNKCGWQYSVISACALPCFDNDILYILNELGKERKYWVFGFTRKQYIKACETVRQQGRFCTDKTHLKWSKESKLHVYEIAEKDMFIFDDQLIFDKRRAI